MSIASAFRRPLRRAATAAPSLRRRAAAWTAAAVLASTLPAVTGVWPTAARGDVCLEGTESRLVVELLFGRNIGAHVGVSEEAFQRFVDQEVTPRFPAGFTLLDTVGQWRPTSSREIVREPGKQLVIALSDEARELPLVREIMAVYKRQFSQQSVGVITRRACVAF